MDSKWIPACSKTQKKSAKIAQGYVCSGCHTRAGEDVPMVERSKKKILLKDNTTHVQMSRLGFCHWLRFFHTASDGELGGIKDEAHPPTLTKCLLANTHCINHCIVWYVVQTS